MQREEVTARHRQCNLRSMSTLPVDKRPGNVKPEWLHGREFRYLYYRVRYMRWCYAKFYGRWVCRIVNS